MIPTTNLFKTTSEKIDVFGNKNFTEEQLYGIYDETLAQTKCIMGVVNQCAYYAMMEALDRIKKTPLYKQRIKKCFNDAFNLYQEREKRLRYGNWKGLQFFKAQKTDPNSPDRHVPTNQELFDWWLDVGACSYKRYVNQVEMLRIQMLQILTYKQAGKYKVEASYVWVAASMLQYSFQVFNFLMKDFSSHNRMSNEDNHKTFARTFSDFSLEPVYNAWVRAANMICDSPDDMSLPKFLYDNLRNAYNSFQRVIMNDFKTMDSADEAITQNKELLDPEVYAEYRRNYDEAKKEFLQQHDS